MTSHRMAVASLFAAAAFLFSAAALRAEDKAPSLAIAPFDAKSAIQHQQAWAKRLKSDVEITNSIGMKLRLIPAGEFMMGSPESDKDAEDGEKPQHRVRITKPFYLGKFEVTRGEFRKFVTATKYKTDAETDGWGGSGFTVEANDPIASGPEYSWRNANIEQTDQHPVVNVSWNDAVEFCRWLSLQEGKIYRLPTEAEWEYGCRAGTTGRWNCGDKEADLQGKANLADASLQAKFAKLPRDDTMNFDCVNWNDGAPFTSPVGKYTANRFGLHDMHGNVCEWCSDWGDPPRKYYANSPIDDPPGAPKERWSGRVKRGGSFLSSCSPPSTLRSADRSWGGQNSLYMLGGFRVVLATNGHSANPPASTLSSLPTYKPTVSPPNNTAVPANTEAKQEITNSLGIKLRLSPAGHFLMGSPDSIKDADADEKPQHRVRITKPFYIGKCEVTRGEFQKFVTATNYVTDAEKDDLGGWGHMTYIGHWIEQDKKFTWRDTGFEQTDRHPVVNVSWNDAVAFCDWLSQQERQTYRLPTEAEWEYACRAGTLGRWSTGDKDADLEGYANLADASQLKKLVRFEYVKWNDAAPFTSIVATYKPNPFGLHDMHGNVREWCSDRYDPAYYRKSSADDPLGPETGSARVFRGGSWYDAFANCTSAYRGANLPANRYLDLGFRVARDVPVAKPASK